MHRLLTNLCYPDIFAAPRNPVRVAHFLCPANHAAQRPCQLRVSSELEPGAMLMIGVMTHHDDERDRAMTRGRRRRLCCCHPVSEPGCCQAAKARAGPRHSQLMSPAGNLNGPTPTGEARPRRGPGGRGSGACALALSRVARPRLRPGGHRADTSSVTPVPTPARPRPRS